MLSDRRIIMLNNFLNGCESRYKIKTSFARSKIKKLSFGNIAECNLVKTPHNQPHLAVKKEKVSRFRAGYSMGTICYCRSIYRSYASSFHFNRDVDCVVERQFCITSFFAEAKKMKMRYHVIEEVYLAAGWSLLIIHLA